MTRSILSTGTALALVLTATAALAGGQPSVGDDADVLIEPAYASLGDNVSGELTAGDSRTSSDGLMDRYLLDLQAGTRVEIIMRSEAFDTYLIAGFLGADGFEQIALDDDGLGEELNSRLRFTAAETGRYEIRARGFAALGEGTYSLAFGEQTAPESGRAPGSLVIGSEVNGTLTDDDARSPWDASYIVDDYVFSARAGDRIQAVVRSSEFDTTAGVSHTSRWGVVQQLAFDDDGLGEGTDSRLRFTALEDGEYTLQVTSFAPGSTGAYSVALSVLEPWPEPTTIEYGVPVSGTLSDTDPLGDDDRRFDAYAFDAETGQRIEIVGESVAFPARLTLFSDDGAGGREAVAFDNNYDDASGPTRLIYTVEAAGRYEVWVGATSEEPRGAYTLEVNDRGPLPPPPPPGSISVGDSLSGVLSRDDGVSTDEKSFDDYNITTSPGQRLSVTMRADGFDTYLNVYRVGPDGGLTEVTSDDDSAGDLDSRATFESEGGLYRIRATSFSMGELGDYSLAVRDLGRLVRPTPLRLGRTYRGALDQTDPLTDAEGHFDSYGFHLEAGERAQFIARSDAFDVFLTVAVRDEAGHEFLVFDNDGLGDGTTNSRLTFIAPESGDYELWVTSLAMTAETGAYTLESRDLGPEQPSASLVIGATIEGQLQDGDNLTFDATFYDGFSFRGVAGQRVRVDMASPDFDTFVLLGIHGADGLNAIGENDDVRSGDTNSSLSMVLPSDALYEVWATSYAAGEAGAYTLTLSDLGPEPEPGSLLLGSTVRGELTDQDPVGANGVFDAFQFETVAGQEVRITLTSNAFDAYVELGRMQDGVFTLIAEDDDSLSDLNSLLVFTPEDSGPYVVRARSYSSGESGAYVLSVE